MQNQAKGKISIVLFFALFFFVGNLTAQKKDKLIIGIVVDQMCYEYLYRFQHHFTNGGFNKFLLHGTNCRNTNYNYVPTYTGPGHASIYTGTTPSDHGIVGNQWYDNEAAKMVNCVGDGSVHSIGVNSKHGKASPHRLKTYTISDQLKLTYPTAKVISVSIKDRGAILPGGHLSDGTYWFDYLSGKFITSSYYKEQLPIWIHEFNKDHNADTYLKDWTLLYPEANYNSIDDSPYELLLDGKSKATFPYKFKPGDYSNFVVTPSANTLLTDLALTAIDFEELGADAQTDLLCISYSTPDIAGHSFGPYSLEIEDMYARLDLEIAKLLTALDKKIGKHNYKIFITADHAVVPVPQQLIDKKLPGGYLPMYSNLETLKKSVQEKYGASLILTEANQNIYLNHSQIDSLHLDKNAVQEFIASEIRKWKEVKAVYTEKELINAQFSNGDWGDMIVKGYDQKRSGDIIFITHPGFLPIHNETELSGTSHGSAFNYDTHVPLLWYGAGIKHKDVFDPIQIIDIAPTLTHLLYLQRSGAMTGIPIKEILEK